MRRTDPLEFLVQLETYTLDSAFEAYGDFAVARADGKTHFHGNFADLSAVFDFVLAGEEATRVELAIRRHQRGERYRAADRDRRLRLARGWARRQTDRWGDVSATGGAVLRLAEAGELEKAEKVMAERTQV